MDGGKTAALVADDSADTQYVRAKTSVWWDIENCHVPRRYDPYSIAQNIISALSKMNYRGPISISAYGDTNQIPSPVQQALSSTGISLNHVPAGVKDASDKKILVDMLLWAVDNPAPATYLLISGDRDFSNALHQLRMRRYDILLAQPSQASAALVSAAKTVWLWTSLIAGGGPIRKSEMAQPVNGGNQSNLDALSMDSPNQCNQQGPKHQKLQNQQLSGSKRPPLPPKSEKKSSRAKTETTQEKNKDAVQCHNCGKLGHMSKECKKTKRMCFICGREGHMNTFCSQGGSTSCNNNTAIGPASQQAMVMEQRMCYICKKQGHMRTSCPHKNGFTQAQSQTGLASYYSLPCNNPIGMPAEAQPVPASYISLSCNDPIGRPAQSQPLCNNPTEPAFQHNTAQNTGIPVASFSQGQELYGLCNVAESKTPDAQAFDSDSRPANEDALKHGSSLIADSVVPTRSP